MLSIKSIIRISFNVGLIVLMFVLGWKYIVGLLLGMALMGYLLLFPSSWGIYILNRMFGYEDSMAIHMLRKQSEMERDEHEIKNKRKVKYQKQ